MNKKLIALALFAGSVSVVQAADGTIKFTGNVTETACEVQSDASVALGNIQKSAFLSGAGATAGATRFTITLTNCPISTTSATVKFDGTANSTNSSLLALNTGSTAKGLGVALFEADGSTPIPLATASNAITLATTTGADESAVNRATATYVAKYMSTAAAVTAGTADATTNFTVSYN
ncbi:fimbrial protein [Serratia quinivorans]|uniref:fimbrial protein n=1 Tax=Serratia quinivorans TaxID=137545 RepID=UPI001C464796|nr:fimbrial protein [Serratia quinivorans]MBV6694000.1 fimbrial protein [Serratia quinivorans]